MKTNTERTWHVDPDGVEHEFAFDGSVSYPTGQKRRKLPNGEYHQFTVLDHGAIDLPPDDGTEAVFELSPTAVIDDEDDGIDIIVEL